MNLEHYFSPKSDDINSWKPLQVNLLGQTRNLVTTSGIFSPEKIDKGTEIFLKYVPNPPKSGMFLDIGCGWGPLSLSLSMYSPQSKIWAIDTNMRCVKTTLENSRLLGLTNIICTKPEDLNKDILFDTIWSNPPIRVGKQMLHSILLMWLPKLNHGGSAWLVVQKNLGADSLLIWLIETLDNLYPHQFVAKRFASDKNFRILQINRNIF